jgi:hypothetical protein
MPRTIVDADRAGWLHACAPNVLLILGTASLNHLRGNLSARELKLSAEHFASLDEVGRVSGWMIRRNQLAVHLLHYSFPRFNSGHCRFLSL